ncbi:MAG: ACT domain-containing protein [Metallosphaera sp.]|uniref:Uncharacterized protein n=1 Tax=Metallosphaera cuprina (strain Ar-4) TaxID=1006006 RepID=F4FZN5_METCR|nr:ACT domain-containing protein [Metallosphaera cuprina]AEB94464.1 conserved hypothetical protein [Metallosphaera cuprina Ar-4]
MTQGRLLRVIGYYRDPGFLERIIGVLRKLWVDIEWINARRVNDEGLYEVYMEVKEGKNTNLAIVNLSKTVDVERVEVLEEGKTVLYSFNNKGEISKEPNNDNMIVYVPVYSKIVGYSWGESYSKDLH